MRAQSAGAHWSLAVAIPNRHSPASMHAARPASHDRLTQPRHQARLASRAPRAAAGAQVFEKGNFAGLEEMKRSERLFARVAPMGVADIAVAVRYEHVPRPPLAGTPILALDGLADATIDPAAMGQWAAYTSGRFRNVPVMGDHYFVSSRFREARRGRPVGRRDTYCGSRFFSQGRMLIWNTDLMPVEPARTDRSWGREQVQGKTQHGVRPLRTCGTDRWRTSWARSCWTCWTRSGAACWASTPGCEHGSQPPSPPSDHAASSFFRVAAVSDVMCCYRGTERMSPALHDLCLFVWTLV